MARYILIDHNSGYIWGDSADLDGKIFNGSPIEYAIALDASLKEFEGTYAETSRHDDRRTYDCFRVDVDGSEVIPVVQDGTDQDTINAVLERGHYITSLVREPLAQQ